MTLVTKLVTQLVTKSLNVVTKSKKRPSLVTKFVTKPLLADQIHFADQNIGFANQNMILLNKLLNEFARGNEFADQI